MSPEQRGFSDFFEGLGRTVAFHPELARMLGSIKAALFLQQLMFWTPKATDPRGVYKTAVEWEEETSLTYEDQLAARKLLHTKGVLEQQYARLEHRMFFRVNKEALDELWAKWRVGRVPTPDLENFQVVTSEISKSVLPGDDSQRRLTGNYTATGAPTDKPPEQKRSAKKDLSRNLRSKPDSLAAGFDQLWKVIPKRISKGTAKVEAWEIWKGLRSQLTPQHVTEMVRLLKVSLAEDPKAYSFYNIDGSARVTPAKLIELLCVAMRDGVSLDEVLESDYLEAVVGGGA